MTSFEAVFNSSSLQVVAPQTALEFPEDYADDKAADWFTRLEAEPTDRKVAFFDENIDFLLVVRFPSRPDDEGPAEDTEAPKPPPHLLSFLAHLQITYDALYISPTTETVAVDRPPVPPPRTISKAKTKPSALLSVAHPSIFPPSTPHPIPHAAEADKQYVQAQGTPLTSGVWGEQPAGSLRETSEAFALLWGAKKQEWVAVYRMSVLVRYMNTKFPDPLLSLTVSTTLRERPLAITPARRALLALINEAGGLPGVSDPSSPVKPTSPHVRPGENDGQDVTLSGLEEANLLEGLQLDPTFANGPPLNLPSTRLGPVTRRSAFSLPPILPLAPSSNAQSPLPSMLANKDKLPPLPASSTFRKSFRKTMKVVSGFNVRMRTVFVPYFVLSGGSKRRHKEHASTDNDGSEDETDALGHEEDEEHTVLLSVEVENLFPDLPAPSVPNYSFEIERADVTVSGTGARTVLIAWGDEYVFPLRIAPGEQVNLLYAVSFLRAPELDEVSLVLGAGADASSKRASINLAAAAAQEARRSVSISLSVRPFEHAGTVTTRPAGDAVSYPTRTYASYWSVKLNFSTASNATIKHGATDGLERTVLPTPASPFSSAPTPAVPVASSRPVSLPVGQSPSQGQNIAGSRRFTLGALESSSNTSVGNKARSPVNYQGSTAMLNPANQPQNQGYGSLPTSPLLNPIVTGTSPGNRASYLQPLMRSPTTYSSPQDSYFSFSALGMGSSSAGHISAEGIPKVSEDPTTPRTPAYPAYPSSPPPIPATPFWQAPLSQQTGAGSVGPTVDMRRDRGGPLPTPGVNVPGFPMSTEVGAEVEMEERAGGQPIIVSVGLLPVEGKGLARGAGEIYPLDQFTLDIFVFNQSSWTRRFEISHPDERRRRRRARKGDASTPGILPLENRVRIGPLLPTTCQSVRMDFLALEPGVHPIEELILTDIQTGLSKHLRSVIDIVVHEPFEDISISSNSNVQTHISHHEQ